MASCPSLERVSLALSVMSMTVAFWVFFFAFGTEAEWELSVHAERIKLYIPSSSDVGVGSLGTFFFLCFFGLRRSAALRLSVCLP